MRIKQGWKSVLVGVLAVAALAAILLYARYGPLIASWLAGRTISADAGLGAWGDSFCALNATVSTLAFIGILVTLLLHGRGLREQNHDQHRQRFEASFFELLKLQREARRELLYFNTTEFEQARVARKYTTFSSATAGRLPADGPIDPVAAADLEIHFQLLESGGLDACDKNDVVQVYMRYVHSASESTVAPYFRLIYSVLDRVRSDEVLTRQEKIRHGNLVRSQLSSAEVLLLGVNSLAPISADMRTLVTEFRMLKYLPKSSMRDLLTRFHDPLAFVGRDDPVSQHIEQHDALHEQRYLSIVAALQPERRLQCLSRKRLAERIGRAKSFVSDYEEGRVPLNLVEFVDVARGLGRRPAYFFRERRIPIV